MTEEKLLKLLHSMTRQEKIGQLVQVPGDVFQAQGQELGVRDALGIEEEMLQNAGSTLNVLGAEQTRRVQEAYLKRSRHKIPLLFMADIIYGFRTVYPIPLALGCSFEPDLLQRLCVATAEESVASGAHVTFAPMADLVRDARWGRCLESTGEDPYMNALYAAAMVKGFQQGLGEEGKPKGLASCVKHFAAYGAAEGGRDYNTVDMSERRLRQEYLPSYKAGVEVGCEMVMTSFNTIDQIPATANQWLMGEVLRKEWGFDGVLITDYAAIAELVTHGVAEDQKEAAKMAMEAGVDIDMCTGCYANWLDELIEEGSLTEEQLDQAVLRVLRLKNKLGLFEDPFRSASCQEEQERSLNPEYRALAREAARKTMVLLENREAEGEKAALPLEGTEKIALIGPFADCKRALGMWAIHGRREEVVTLKEALEERGSDVVCAKGCEALLPEDYTDLPALAAGTESGNLVEGPDGLWDEAKREKELEKAVEAARAAGVAILALGEDEIQGGEGGSRTKLTIPGDQMKLLRAVRDAAKKVVVVLYAGRPLVLDEVKELADAILLVWYPGTEGGHAICDVLFGEAEPEGRLAMSLPRSVGQLPLYYNSFSTGRPYDGKTPNRFFSRYTDCANTPLYPYGYGLSYHKAEYGPTVLDRKVLKRGGSLEASVRIANLSPVPGTEVAQLYLRDVCGSVVRPVKELKAVKKIHLEPGETKTVAFTITEEMLRFYGKEMRYEAQAGKFRVVIAPNSSAVPEEEFELREE